MNKDKLIDKAILETIFHWQRSEYKYYKAIQIAFDNRLDKQLLTQFSEIEYYEFLTSFNVRRSLPGKEKLPVTRLTIDMFKKNGFAEKVKEFESNPNIIDKYCEELSKKKEISGGKRLLSLITKTAFILKPNIIPLYDNYAKNSLKKNNKSIKITDFKSYFIAFKNYKASNIDLVRSKVVGYNFIFEKFDEFKAFEDIHEFIAHRSIDKILWMEYDFYRKNKKTARYNA
jgi:hypothetical protein